MRKRRREGRRMEGSERDGERPGVRETERVRE
jgi:hypothetical protein